MHAVENSSCGKMLKAGDIITDRPRFCFNRSEEYETLSLIGDSLPNETRVSTESSPVMNICNLRSTHIYLRDHLKGKGLEFNDTEALVIRDCVGCEIMVDLPVGTVHIVNVQHCQVTLCAVKSSVHVRNTTTSTIIGFCGQLRVTDSGNLLLCVQTGSSTALANCTQIRVQSPPDISTNDAFTDCLARLDLLNDTFLFSERWKNVRDFDCLFGASENWKFS